MPLKLASAILPLKTHFMQNSVSGLFLSAQPIFRKQTVSPSHQVIAKCSSTELVIDCIPSFLHLSFLHERKSCASSSPKLALAKIHRCISPDVNHDSNSILALSPLCKLRFFTIVELNVHQNKNRLCSKTCGCNSIVLESN